MRSLLRYLLKHYAFVLFVLLEAISLLMVVNYNSYQRARYLNSANWLSGNIYRSVGYVKDYFRLASINDQLAEENVRMKSYIDTEQPTFIDAGEIIDSTGQNSYAYRYTSARVINNSVNRLQNYITLDKGSKDGIKPDQGIIAGTGVVGVITEVSGSFSVGLSLLNSRWSVSAKLKRNGYFGSLTWTDNNYRVAQLNEIPLHVDISIGDTVVTSGYSSIFPEGIMLGTVRDFSRPEGENYYAVDILLSTDFKKLSYVEVIENMNRPEIKELENRTGND